MGSVGKYTGAALTTKERIMDGNTSYYANQTYYNAKHNIYWFINQRGYLHILQPCAVRLNGKISHYAINDLLLTKDNMLSDCGSFGDFETVQKVVEYLQNKHNKSMEFCCS